MRIIDKQGRFDYYDCIQKTIFDREIIFNRDSLIVKPKRQKYHDFYVLKFCNNIYKFARFNGEFYHDCSLYKTAYKKYHKECSSRYQYYGLEVYNAEKRFNLDYSHYLKYSEPLVLFCDERIEYSPIIKLYGFEKIIDPYTAFQEIYMYLAAQAKPEKVIPEMSNKDKAFSKGFDKYSFRKDKQNK